MFKVHTTIHVYKSMTVGVICELVWQVNIYTYGPKTFNVEQLLISYFRNTDQLQIHIYQHESINVSRHTKRSYVAMGEPFLMSQITKQHPINDYTGVSYTVINLLHCTHQC